MTTATAEAVKPTPTEVAASAIAEALHAEQECSFDKKKFHKFCRKYGLNKKTMETAKDAFEKIRADLQAFVDTYGFTPSTADKTLRCETELYQADVQRAIPVEINDARVVQFQSLCKNIRRPQLFPRIFSRRVEYSLIKGADKIIESASVPKKHKEAFVALYALCFTPNPKSPSLKVIDVQAEAVATAEKAAAAEAKKAAKKAEKAAAKSAARTANAACDPEGQQAKPIERAHQRAEKGGN
jgi:hypothetical protein